MDNFEQPKFEIKMAMEKKPFESPAVQAFFAKWCEINSSIEPRMVDRENWEKRGGEGILENNPDNKQTLYLPKDLQLWEMVGVMEAVDHDTFANKPERQDKAKEKILELGKTFENAGIYIAQRLDSVKQGKEIASALAEEFYDYGQSLVRGKKSEKFESINDIKSHALTNQETIKVDRFLAGDNLYKSRRARADKKGEFYETERQKTLNQFFRASEKAFELERKSERGELKKDNIHLRPWQNDAPLHSAFITKIEKAMKQKIETPKREFEAAIFRRGLEKIGSEVKERETRSNMITLLKELGIDISDEQRKLADALNIKWLKAELETVRQSNDIAKISLKEREIADKIQKAVSGFPRKTKAHNPAEIAVNQYINCLGASMLGGVLMQEAGLNYLVGAVPRHSVLFLVNSDGRVEWRDMLKPSLNEDLTDDMIVGSKKEGSPFTVEDIAAFSKNPASEGLMFDIKSEKYRDKLKWVEEGQRQFVTVFEPEYGQKIQLLNNTGHILRLLGRNKEAIEAYRQAIAVNPKYSYPYNGLGNALYFLGRNEEAIEAYRQAIAIDPKDVDPYNGLGNILHFLGRNNEALEIYNRAILIDPKDVIPYNGLGNTFRSLAREEEAIEAYIRAISIDPKYTDPYFGLGNALKSLGRDKEAIEAYRKFVDLADKQKKDFWIKKAEQAIGELKNK